MHDVNYFFLHVKCFLALAKQTLFFSDISLVYEVVLVQVCLQDMTPPPSICLIQSSIQFWLVNQCFISDVIECSSYLKSQLVRYIFKTRKLERALKIKDVLCSSLTEKLDVMREEKTSRTTDYASRNMNNNRVSASNCSQLEECNGYSCSANEPDSTREQIRSGQNEGNKEKMDKTAVSGSVICSNEGHVLKTKLENVEKEFNQMKDELSKVCTEKSQVKKKEKNSNQDFSLILVKNP